MSDVILDHVQVKGLLMCTREAYIKKKRRSRVLCVAGLAKNRAGQICGFLAAVMFTTL